MGEFKGSAAANDLSVALSNDELHILINLVEQLLELLGERNFTHHYQSDDPFAQLMAATLGNIESPIDQPEDPVLRRLLPNGYADPESAAEISAAVQEKAHCTVNGWFYEGPRDSQQDDRWLTTMSFMLGLVRVD